jgi:hypothetical protein
MYKVLRLLTIKRKMYTISSFSLLKPNSNENHSQYPYIVKEVIKFFLTIYRMEFSDDNLGYYYYIR